METTIRHLGGVQFEAITRGHRVVCDLPAEHGGLDLGMTPPEYLLVSLGSCAGYYAAQYLKARNLKVEGLEIKVTGDKTTQPARLGRLHIEVIAPNVDARHEEGLHRAIQSCLVHNTLTHPPVVETVVCTPAAAS